MGWIALYVLLGSIFLGIISVIFLAYCLFSLYKTARYSYRDLKPWMGKLREFADDAHKSLAQLEERGAGLAGVGEEMRRNLEDIKDVIEEIKSHPVIWTASKVSKYI